MTKELIFESDKGPYFRFTVTGSQIEQYEETLKVCFVSFPVNEEGNREKYGRDFETSIDSLEPAETPAPATPITTDFENGDLEIIMDMVSAEYVEGNLRGHYNAVAAYINSKAYYEAVAESIISKASEGVIIDPQVIDQLVEEFIYSEAFIKFEGMNIDVPQEKDWLVKEFIDSIEFEGVSIDPQVIDQLVEELKNSKAFEGFASKELWRHFYSKELWRHFYQTRHPIQKGWWESLDHLVSTILLRDVSVVTNTLTFEKAALDYLIDEDMWNSYFDDDDFQEKFVFNSVAMDLFKMSSENLEKCLKAHTCDRETIDAIFREGKEEAFAVFSSALWRQLGWLRNSYYVYFFVDPEVKKQGVYHHYDANVKSVKTVTITKLGGPRPIVAHKLNLSHTCTRAETKEIAQKDEFRDLSDAHGLSITSASRTRYELVGRWNATANTNPPREGGNICPGP